MQKKEENKIDGKEIKKEIAFFLLIFLFNFFIVRNYIAEGVTVDGASMQNTLYNNERLFVEKISVRLDRIERFDIITFDPQNGVDDYWVKRIIGLPGETVQIIGEDIYINGEVLKENYGKDPIDDPGIFEEAYTLAEDEYFVLGDNRQNSTDSRVVGPIKKDVIEGKPIFRFWPLDRISGLE